VTFQVTFDAVSPEELARFWALALGYVDDSYPPEFASLEDFLRSIGIPESQFGDQWALVDPGGTGPRLYFQRVPEGKTAKNRVHLDIRVADRSVSGAPRAEMADAMVARLVAAGATFVRLHDDDLERWTVMQDPEGNEFCVTLRASSWHRPRQLRNRRDHLCQRRLSRAGTCPCRQQG